MRQRELLFFFFILTIIFALVDGIFSKYAFFSMKVIRSLFELCATNHVILKTRVKKVFKLVNWRSDWFSSPLKLQLLSELAPHHQRMECIMLRVKCAVSQRWVRHRDKLELHVKYSVNWMFNSIAYNKNLYIPM